MKNLRLSDKFALPLDVAGEAIAILATRGAGKSYTSAVLIEELYKTDVQTVTIDPTGVYWGLRSGYMGLADGLPIIVLGGAHGDVPLAETAGKLIADLIVDTSQSLVLDLSDFDSDAAQCRFMTDFAERLYRRKARSRTTLHLIVDEADEFAPQQPQAKEARMVGAMAKLVRRGRSRGIGLTLITQRSASLNKNMLDLVETLLLMRMLGPRDRDAAKGWIKHKNLADELGVLDSLPSLPTGTAWVWSPLRDVLEKVAMRKIGTFDSYVTPKPGEVRVEPKALAKVDLDKLGAQIKATAEKAKAEDPAALRKRIAELEGDARARTTIKESYITQDHLKAEYQRGKIDGYKAAIDSLVPAVDRLATLQSAITEVLGEFSRDFTKWKQSRPPTQSMESAIARAKPGDVIYPPQTETKSFLKPTSSANGSLPRAERLVLTALAQYPEGRSTIQIAVITGYAVGGGGFRNALGALRSKGYIDGHGDRLVATQAGLDALGPYDPLPTGQELLQYWYRQLGKAERKALEALVDEYPKSLSVQQIANRAGYEVGGGGFRNALGRLRTLELIRGRGEIRASDNLF